MTIDEFTKNYVRRYDQPSYHVPTTGDTFRLEWPIGSYTLNKQGKYDIIGTVDIAGLGLSKLPFKFGKVIGSFYCMQNNLTSLEGAPEIVTGCFWCSNNNLTSLEGGPRIVKLSFDCSHNNLTTLKGSPEKVGANFYCISNPLSEEEMFLINL